MKKIIAAFVFAICVIQVYAQPTSHKFCAVFGGNTGQEYGYDVKQTLDHGYIVAGTTNSIGNGITDAYLIRTDTIGIGVWQKVYGGINVDNIRALDILPDSGFIFAGYTNSYGSGGYDGWLLRTDKNGDTLWTKTYGGTDWDLIYSVKRTFDGGFILAGGTYSAGNGDEDVYLIKTDASGNIEWARTYGGTRQDEAREVVQYPLDSGYVLAATTHSLGDTLGDGWLIRTDSDGDTIWTKILGRPDTADMLHAVACYPPNGVITAVGQTEAVAGNLDETTFDVLSNGQFAFVPGYPVGSFNDWNSGVCFHRDGRSAIIGTAYSAGSGNGDFKFAERNFTGFCYTTFGTLQQDEAFAIDTTADKGYIACGFSTGYLSPLPDMYLLKIDSVCSAIIVLGLQEATPAPQSGAAGKFYPNPVSAEARLLVSSHEILLDVNDWKITVYDMSGREIRSEKAELVNSSDHHAEIFFQKGNLAAGCYSWQITDKNSAVCSGKLLIAE